MVGGGLDNDIWQAGGRNGMEWDGNDCVLSFLDNNRSCGATDIALN
jgi:hypothetical protein